MAVCCMFCLQCICADNAASLQHMCSLLGLPSSGVSWRHQSCSAVGKACHNKLTAIWSSAAALFGMWYAEARCVASAGQPGDQAGEDHDAAQGRWQQW